MTMPHCTLTGYYRNRTIRTDSTATIYIHFNKVVTATHSNRTSLFKSTGKHLPTLIMFDYLTSYIQSVNLVGFAQIADRNDTQHNAGNFNFGKFISYGIYDFIYFMLIMNVTTGVKLVHCLHIFF